MPHASMRSGTVQHIVSKHGLRANPEVSSILGLQDGLQVPPALQRQRGRSGAQGRGPQQRGRDQRPRRLGLTRQFWTHTHAAVSSASFTKQRPPPLALYTGSFHHDGCFRRLTATSAGLFVCITL